MKKIIFYTTFLTASLVLFSSCKKYLDINQNPNAAEEPPINGLLANTTYRTAFDVFNASDWTSYYTQYLASSNAGSAGDTYDEVDPSGTWDGFYNVMTDLYDLRKFAIEKGQDAYEGVADILMSLHINMATNLWGDIPYSQSFLGVNKITPAFDNQQSLFDTCIALLDKGIAELQKPGADGELDAASDFIHGGDADAWIKTAHALKARMLNQLSKTNKYSATAILSELSQAYSGNGDDAQVTSYQVRNPWAQVAVNNAGLNLDGWLSSYFVNAMNGATYGVFDPRLPLITLKTKYGDYRGTPNGKGRIGTGTQHEECYLDVGKWYSSDNSPLQIITYPECKFIEAEASYRSSQPTNAYAAYLAGIQSNMQKMGVPDTAIQRYINEPSVAVGASNLTLALIMKEKYVACFLSPVTWDDMRRMNYLYKDFALPFNAVINTFIRRMSYPIDETSTNGANVPDISGLDQRLWWDN
ncbi:MAG: SusD/RagB family nutrient-binding outer membrane lipoprotein [Bacteroidetes bacterium]|nr:SusD/RagB family nutrient-binding outer membrane lipoprotein [Bacteroidota bacterium]